MRNWVKELPMIKACIQNLAQASRNWRTAFNNDRFEACDGFTALKGELFERYRQLGGLALQIGDLVDFHGNIRTPEDVAARIEECAIAQRAN
jgi:hypothetical protein